MNMNFKNKKTFTQDHEKCNCAKPTIAEEQEEKPTWSYHSNVLNKDFKTLDELKQAEITAAKEKAEADAKSMERDRRAKEVRDALVEVEHAKEEAKKVLDEARQKAYDLIKAAEDKADKLQQDFAKDYHGYHTTVIYRNGKKYIGFSDMLESFDEIQNTFDTVVSNFFKHF